ncbi:MAG: hypothetical protein HKM07_02510 [Chlamydiae bacterium]|nr:hypothetical protein [Chlamydiota bacterium]
MTIQTGKKLKDEKGLILIGTCSQMMDNIQLMGMSFNFYQTVDLSHARELLIYSIEKYLSSINSDQKIRPYLHEYPFGAKNVEISIHFYNPDGSDVALDKIYYASAIDGKLSYYVDLPEKYSRKSIHEETYEQALQLEQK